MCTQRRFPEGASIRRIGLGQGHGLGLGVFSLAAMVYTFAATLSADDWPQWLGPTGDSVSRETGWLKDWPDEGPPRLFEKPIGEGYSAVSIAFGHLLLYHRVKDENRLESRHPETGVQNWTYTEATDYVDRYGYSGGPRPQPLVHRDKDSGEALVFVLDPTGVLVCVDLKKGEKRWRLDLRSEFKLQRNFFGDGAAPIIDGKHLIINLGGTDTGTGFTFALEKLSGKIVWKSPTDGGGYAAGRTAEIDGSRHLLIFHRGGMSCLDPADGRERWKFPWRSRIYDSVNAATPVIVDDLLFFSAAYRTGGVLLRVKKDSFEKVWQDSLSSREKIIATHWSTANYLDGHLYGFSGRHEGGSDLRCVELTTGKVKWKWESYLGRGAMIYSDGHFIAVGERGDLSLLKLSPAGHQELRRVPRVLRHPAWTPPTLANGLLYLRDEHKLVCMDLRVKTER